MFNHTFVCEAQVHKALKHTGSKTNNHTFGMTLNKKGHAKKSPHCDWINAILPKNGSKIPVGGTSSY